MTDPFKSLDRYINAIQAIPFMDVPMLPTVELPEALRGNRGKVFEEEGVVQSSSDLPSFHWRITAAIDSVSFSVKFAESSGSCLDTISRRICQHANVSILRKVAIRGYHLSFLFLPGTNSKEALKSTKFVIRECHEAESKIATAAREFIRLAA